MSATSSRCRIREPRWRELKQFLARPDPMKPQGRRSQRNTAYDDMVVALNRALADAAPLDQQIAMRTQEAAVDRNAAARPRAQAPARSTDLERERRELEELAHTYRTRYEEARMSEDLDREKVVSVSVIQRPDAPTAARPDRSICRSSSAAS